MKKRVRVEKKRTERMHSRAEAGAGKNPIPRGNACYMHHRHRVDPPSSPALSNVHLTTTPLGMFRSPRPTSLPTAQNPHPSPRA